MIRIDLDEKNAIVTVRPEKMTGLTQADFQKIADHIDPYLKQHNNLHGLIIVVETFPGWEDFNAFISHIKFIQTHHRSIKKVAIVSDSPLLTAAPRLVAPFVTAKIRHFSYPHVDQATEWMLTDEPQGGRFIILEGYPDTVLALRAEGTISRDNYEDTLIPLAEQKIKAHGKVKLLYWCGPDFEGFSAGAMWDDARFGLTHLGDISKIAFISDIDWLRMSMKFFAPLIPAPVQVFHNAEIEDAKNWIIKDQVM